MYSSQLIYHPDLQPLMNKFKRQFLGVHLEYNMRLLGWHGYTGLGLDVDAVKKILQKCLDENKYFKVWEMKWKGKVEDMPLDLWEGKVAYYKYMDKSIL